MKPTGKQRKLLRLIAEAGDEGINRVSKQLCKTAGSKPGHVLGRLQEMGCVEPMSASRVRITPTGLAAISNLSVETSQSAPDENPLGAEVETAVVSAGRLTINELQKVLSVPYKHLRPVVSALEGDNRILVEHEPNPLCSVLKPA